MRWYYLREGKEVGPISETALRELHRCGVVGDDSKVRSENTEIWLNLAEAFAIQVKSAVNLKPESRIIKFHCTTCQQKISAETAQAGTTGQCPACGADFVVPDASAEAADEKVAATAAADPEPTDEAVEEVTHPVPVHEHEAGPSLANRLKEGAKEGWSGVKRHSKQAALRAQAEKLRNVDLRKGHHSLGKKCFESGMLEDALAEQFQAIRDLDATIAQKREAEEVHAGETKMDAMKRMGKHAAKAGHAHALALKREHLITELGRQAHARASEAGVDGLQNELDSIADIEARIRGKEQDARKLGDGGKSRTPTLVVAALLFVVLVVAALGVRKAHRDSVASDLVKEADAFAFGTKGVQNWSKAVELLEQAVELGSHEAEYKLGSCHLFGHGVPKNTDEGVNLIRRSAEGGFAEAQFNLSVSYAKGHGVEQSEEEMLKWLKAAANQGFPRALHHLGQFYLNGQVVPQNQEKGIELITNAANQGLVQAQYELSLCHEMGNGVPKDMVEACKWAIIATRSGLDGGDDAVSELKARLSPDQVATAERMARDWQSR